MISKELKSRAITSIFLLISLILMLNFSFVLVSLLLLIFVFSWIEMSYLIEENKNIKNNFLLKLIFKFIFFIYLLFFSKLILFEFLDNKPNISWSLLFLIFVCILTDIGGFIFGKVFKGRKLTKISPNKTYNGMIGSFLLPLIFAIFYSYSLSFVDFQIVIFITIIVSLISQIGDLFISLLKRMAKVKDTGNILPGHGGILDRIDGILFAIPSGIILLDIIYI